MWCCTRRPPSPSAAEPLLASAEAAAPETAAPAAAPRQVLPCPAAFGDLLPGVGRAVPGQVEHHHYVGAERPKIEVVQPPADGWARLLRQHTEYFIQEIVSPAPGTTVAAFEEMCMQRGESSERWFGACDLCLSAWPRGTGAGELLERPIVDDTPPRHRGVSAEWWLEVARRAPFVPTRIFVEAFVKPVTKADLCALWFFIPERFRAKPQDSPGGVFISHAWDLAMWDIRPDPGSVIWLDTLAIVQHRAEVPEGAPAKDAYPELMDLCPTVQSIANTLLILGGDVHGLLPLRRSWCCYELAHTPKGRLRVRAGWSDWNYRGQQEIRQGIDSLDMSTAQAFDQADKQMIDELVVESFGSFDKANDVVRASVLHGYFISVAEAYQLAPVTSDPIQEIDESMARLSSEGQQPLLDKRVLSLFADTVEDKARLDELAKAQSLQEWSQGQATIHRTAAQWVPATKVLEASSQGEPRLQPQSDVGGGGQRQVLNEPGHWDFMISYTQRNPAAEILATNLYNSIRERGGTLCKGSCWLDVKMRYVNEAAMREGVQNCRCFIAIVTGPYNRAGAAEDENPEDSAYFKRAYCIQELRWAVEAGVPIQPVILREDKHRIGNLLSQAPSDLKHLGGVDFMAMDQISPLIWNTCVDELLRKTAELAAGSKQALKNRRR